MTQINPPFNRSAPCPMCQQDLRNVAAILHNAHNRLGTSCLIGKLYDLLAYHSEPITLTVPHPATQALVDFHAEMVSHLKAGMTVEGLTIRWTPECREAVYALVPKWRAVMKEVELLSDAHFEDERHSGGRDNVLRARRGSRGDFWGNGGGDYNYTVERVSEGGDIQHEVCGARYALHDHFKEKMAADANFYGQVWCDACRVNAPFHQFMVLS